jgi:hypothetical protein
MWPAAVVAMVESAVEVAAATKGVEAVVMVAARQETLEAVAAPEAVHPAVLGGQTPEVVEGLARIKMDLVETAARASSSSATYQPNPPQLLLQVRPS